MRLRPCFLRILLVEAESLDTSATFGMKYWPLSLWGHESVHTLRQMEQSPGRRHVSYPRHFVISQACGRCGSALVCQGTERGTCTPLHHGPDVCQQLSSPGLVFVSGYGLYCHGVGFGTLWQARDVAEMQWFMCCWVRAAGSSQRSPHWRVGGGRVKTVSAPFKGFLSTHTRPVEWK